MDIFMVQMSSHYFRYVRLESPGRFLEIDDWFYLFNFFNKCLDVRTKKQCYIDFRIKINRIKKTFENKFILEST